MNVTIHPPMPPASGCKDGWRYHQVAPAIERAFDTIEHSLRWSRHDLTSLEVQPIFGDPAVESTPDPGIRVLARESRSSTLSLDIGIPLSLAPENNPSKYLAALKLATRLAEFVAREAPAELSIDPRVQKTGAIPDEQRARTPSGGEPNPEGFGELISEMTDDLADFIFLQRLPTTGRTGQSAVAQAETNFDNLLAADFLDRIDASYQREWGLWWRVESSGESNE